MKSFLQRPFPSFVFSKTSYRVVLMPAVLVFATLFLLKPFGLHLEPMAKRAQIALAYGACTLLVTMVFILLMPRFFPKLFDQRRWTVGREILYLCVLVSVIAIMNVQVTMWLQNTSFNIGLLWVMTGYTFLIAIIPITASVIIKQQVLLRRFAAEAEAVNRMMQHPIEVEQVEAPTAAAFPQQNILIQGDNQDEILEMNPGDWVAAEANDNYCQIYFLKEGLVQSKLFRTTLKKLENHLEKEPGLYRCHKSFLVNLQQVNKLSGNAQGYRLHMKNTDLQIPVSRSLNASLKEKLTHLPF